MMLVEAPVQRAHYFNRACCAMKNDEAEHLAFSLVDFQFDATNLAQLIFLLNRERNPSSRDPHKTIHLTNARRRRDSNGKEIVLPPITIKRSSC